MHAGSLSLDRLCIEISSSHDGQRKIASPLAQQFENRKWHHGAKGREYYVTFFAESFLLRFSVAKREKSAKNQ
jgi:hypothetical protein